MAEWLRPVFSRTKTPILGASTTPLLDRPSTFITESPKTELHEPRRRISRVPSNLSFHASSPPITTPITSNFPKIRVPEVIYHSPSGDQIAESLKVVMMTRDNMEPLPKEYNSTILHLLEEYHDLTIELKEKDDQIENLREQHRRDIREFEELADKWAIKEGEYKLEIKRLELLLVNTKGGLEGLTLARMGSVVYGSGRAKDVVERAVSGIKERNSQRTWDDEDEEHPLNRQATIKPSLGRRRFRSSQTSHASSEDASRNGRSTLRQSYTTYKQDFSDAIAANSDISDSARYVSELSRSLHEHKAQSGLVKELSLMEPADEKIQESPISPPSNKESSPSNTDIYSPHEPSNSSVVGPGVDLEKELPEIPFGPQILGPTTEQLYTPEVTDVVNSELLNAAATGKEKVVTNPLGFSFRPGDDVDLLARDDSIHSTKLAVGERHIRNCTSQDLAMSKLRTPSVVRIPKSIATTATTIIPSRTQRTPSTSSRSSLSSYATPSSQSKQAGRKVQRSTSPTPTPSSIAARRGSRNLEIEVPKRGDSTSSVVTAVRRNSGASANSLTRGAGGRVAKAMGRLDGEGLEDLKEGVRLGTVAVAAAKKAIAGKAKEGEK